MATTYFERVVVGLALAPVDRGLLQYARLIADMGQGHTRITFVHVLTEGAGRPAPVAAVSEARAAIEAALAESFGPADGHQIRVLNDPIVDALLMEAADGGADLIMVGHRRESRGRRSLSRRLALKAPCSVWMVPEGSAPRISSVLAAVDMSPPSARALSLATLVASRAGLNQCTVVHVLAPSRLEYDSEERAPAEHAMAVFLEPLDSHGVAVVRRIEEAGSVSGAVKALVSAAGHDLVVAGTRGRSRSAAILLGSESEQVLMESRVPVLITRESGARIGVLQALLDREFAFQVQAALRLTPDRRSLAAGPDPFIAAGSRHGPPLAPSGNVP